MDCHRTWEALALGAVPVVQRSSIVELYQNHPVLVVDDFLQVSNATLAMFVREEATSHISRYEMGYPKHTCGQHSGGKK